MKTWPTSFTSILLPFFLNLVQRIGTCNLTPSPPTPAKSILGRRGCARHASTHTFSRVIVVGKSRIFFTNSGRELEIFVDNVKVAPTLSF